MITNRIDRVGLSHSQSLREFHSIAAAAGEWFCLVWTMPSCDTAPVIRVLATATQSRPVLFGLCRTTCYNAELGAALTLPAFGLRIWPVWDPALAVPSTVTIVVGPGATFSVAVERDVLLGTEDSPCVAATATAKGAAVSQRTGCSAMGATCCCCDVGVRGLWTRACSNTC
jgi:hypothetical protein